MYFAFASMLFYTTRELISRKLIKDNYSHNRVLLGMRLYGLIFVLFFFVSNYEKESFQNILYININIVYLLIALSSGILGIYLSFRSMRNVSVSDSIPISAVRPIFTIIFSFLLFKDKPTDIGYLGILLIICSVVFSNLISRGVKVSDLRLNLKNKDVQYLLVAVFCFAVSGISYKYIANWIDNSLYIMLVYVSNIIFYSPVILSKMKTGIDFHFDKKLLILGIVAFAGFFFNNLAFQNISATNVVMIQESGAIITLIASMVMFNEKEKYLQKIAVSFVAVAGIVLLTVS